MSQPTPLPDKNNKQVAHLRDAAWVSLLLEQAQARGFFGKLVLTVEHGIVTHCEKQESILPPHRLKENNG